MSDQPIITYSQALEIMQACARDAQGNLKIRQVEIEDCLGRITAKSISSPEVLPSFDNSAMDGFAVRSSETSTASESNPLKFRINGEVAAGDSAPVIYEKNSEPSTWEIMTGAPFPAGFDACIRIEDVEPRKNSDGKWVEIQITNPAVKNQNRRQAGEDFKIASVVLPKGHVIRPEDILVLSSLGITRIEVFAKPRVGVISTGKELVDMRQKISGPQIRNSTAPFLMALLRARGIDAVHLGTVQDDPEKFQELIKKVQLHDLDLVITTGAISMGKFDFIGSSLRTLGIPLLFKKVTMRPGKPILFGKMNEKTFLLGLPGNPISGAVGFRFFADPFLRALQGRKPEVPMRLKLAEATFKPPNTTCFFKGSLTIKDTETRVELHKNQKPSLMHALLESEVWIKIGESAEEVAAGTIVEVYPYLA